jgi:osmotically-inducible protein OsmY
MLMDLFKRLAADGEQARNEAARRARLAVRGEESGGWAGRVLFAGVAGLVGAGLAYLFDPARGRSRRARLADQAVASVRRGMRVTGRAARRVTSDVRGRVTALQHATDEGDPFPDDVTLAARVQSELFRDASVPKGQINVNVERGIVVLRGEVPDDRMRGELIGRVESMTGVWAVRNLLHLPGETAPTEGAAVS